MEDKYKGVLIFDLETAADMGSPTSTHKLRIFGCYSFDDDKYYLLEDKKEMRDMINRHKYLVGFNSVGGVFHGDVMEGYDTQVLYYNGFSDMINKDKDGIFRFKKKTNIDLMMCFKKRASAMKVKKGMLGDLLMRYSLDFISRTIGVVDDTSAKLHDFDYSVLKKESKDWTDEERTKIIEYTKRDLEVTKKMYEWYENYFESFRDFVKEEDIKNKSYLTCSTAVFSYKVLCKELNLKEEYSNVKANSSFIGGYVALPTGEYFSGNILLFDYSSLYPNMFIMGNLFGNNCSCCTKDEKWDGDGFFKLKGSYCKKKEADLTKVLKKIYLLRKEYKKNGDPREYSCKIFLNSSYGAVSNPVFSHIYNKTAGEDCTALGRQYILYSRKRFREEGYQCLMSDTDSIAVKVPDGKTKEDAQNLANKIVKELLSHMPFPW